WHSAGRAPAGIMVRATPAASRSTTPQSTGVALVAPVLPTWTARSSRG
ncbi:MAG: hypothetical protein AVDCRST_MAG52-2643, partial [uncultured Blastococcus sp.]